MRAGGTAHETVLVARLRRGCVSGVWGVLPRFSSVLRVELAHGDHFPWTKSRKRIVHEYRNASWLHAH